jgi:hypothetical protein
VRCTLPTSKKATTRAKTTTNRPTRRAGFLNKLSTAVRGHFATATDLATFLAGAGQLTSEDQKLIVRQALILIEQNYAHLPLKKAMHSIDPVQRLKLLLQTLELGTSAEQLDEMTFHRELTDIFTSVRDLHTNYLLPAPFNRMIAFLPFIVDDYNDAGKRKYVVSRVVQGFTHPTFVAGVEILYWNGTPIERVVLNNGQRYAGSNREARHARGVQTLTVRALRIAPPPDEEWVVVGYRALDGTLAELRFDWQVNPPLPSGDADASVHGANAAYLGLDLEQHIVRGLRLALFAPDVVAARRKARERIARGGVFGDLESQLPDIFTARPVTTPAGTFGYLRIWSFDHWPPTDFVTEFLRLAAGLPQNGLIIDVRGNGGGVINNGELILQTITPERVEPEPLQFVNTPLNLEICRANGPASNWADLTAWVGSIQQSLQTGAVFSAGFPITDPAEANAIGQKYFGPVVLVTDALCYSTTDIFAAGFQDNKVGTILGTDGNTGAGGANVWEHQYFPTDILPGSVYKPLPGGTGMRIAIRRTLRVGDQAGAPLEDLGVIPDQRHFITRNDVLNGNPDLINAAGALLAGMPARALKVTVTTTTSSATVVADTAGITRLDFYVNDRPSQSVDVQTGQTTVTLPAFQLLEVQGFDGSTLVARYRTNA